jgi:hypothetical protein
MSKHISLIALATFSTLSAISPTIAVNAATLKTSNSNPHSFSLVPSQQTRRIASTPNLTPTCQGEDPPCITRPNARQFGDSIIFSWSGSGTVYNVRYPVAGGDKQVENRTGRYTFTRVKPHRVYRISVQACHKPSVFIRTSCTDWETTSFTTR